MHERLAQRRAPGEALRVPAAVLAEGPHGRELVSQPLGQAVGVLEHDVHDPAEVGRVWWLAAVEDGGEVAEEPRLAEALPWLLLRFEGHDAEALAIWAKTRDLQNRLGFTVSLARQVAEHNPSYRNRLDQLRQLEELLEPSRLAREDTYGRREASKRMQKWLRANRSPEARHWNLLTDLKVEHLPYADNNLGAVAELPS